MGLSRISPRICAIQASFLLLWIISFWLLLITIEVTGAVAFQIPVFWGLILYVGALMMVCVRVCVCVVADVGHYPSLPPGETGKRWRDGWMGGGKGGLPGEESPINQPAVSALTWDLSARGVFVCVCVYVCVCVERYHNNSTALSSCQSPSCWPGNLHASIGKP